MAIIDLQTGATSTDFLDPNRKRRIIDLDTGNIAEQDPLILPEEEEETPQERATRLGAVPGIALTPEQVEAIRLGEQITPEPSLLQGKTFTQAPPAEGQPFIRSTQQGLLNIGGGILRGIGELADVAGVENARDFLNELAISQNIEQRETDIITEGAPVQRFAGEVIGETLGVPVGAFGKQLLTRLFSAAGLGAAAGGLSAAGRGESGAAIAAEAGLGATLSPFAEGASVALRSRAAARRATQAGDVDTAADVVGEAAEQIERAQLSQAETGVRLLPAQQTLDPFQLEKQAFLGQNPEVSKKAFNVLKEQNREAARAVSSMLDLIADPVDISTAPARIRREAGNIINTAKLIRAEKASPIYRQAFEQGGNVNLGPVNDLIDSIVAGLPENGGVIKNTVLKAKRLLRGKASVAEDGTKTFDTPSLQQLHGAKLEIDEIINTRGTRPIGATTKRFLTQIEKELVSEMRRASPLYGDAMDEFRRLSPAVDDLSDGVFGRLQSLKDTDLKRASGILFDAAETNPAVLRNALKSLKGIEGGDEIARGLIRTELEKRLGRIKVDLTEVAETGGRRVENIPQLLLNNFFGNAQQKKLLLTGLSELSPGALKNARWLEDVLNRAAAGRPGGSQTGIRAVITQQLRGATLAIRDFFKAPIDTLAGIGEQAQFSRKVRAVGEALYNPDWKPDMDKIRKLNPNSPEARSRFENLLITIVNKNEELGISTQAAGIAARQQVIELLEDEG